MKFCHLVQDQKFQIGSDLIWHYPARAKRAGPKGLRAERARAVTGRREDFLSRQQYFFHGNNCNFGTESRKIVPKVGN